MLPGHDLIAQECLEVSAIAQARYVSKGNFTTAPYLLAELDSRGGQLLIEKLLSLAIKVRFLDDRMGLLRRFGRDLLTIGRYYNDGVLDDDGVTIREALNKLIHHDSIEVHIEEVTARGYFVVAGRAGRAIQNSAWELRQAECTSNRMWEALWRAVAVRHRAFHSH